MPTPTTANALAALVFDFLLNADDDARVAFYDAMHDHAADDKTCPQGATLVVAYLAAATNHAATGGQVAADREANEAKIRKTQAPAPGYYDERLDAVEDVKAALALKRLMVAAAKRANVTASNILCQVPN
jgi:hypothetical protein